MATNEKKHYITEKEFSLQLQVNNLKLDIKELTERITILENKQKNQLISISKQDLVLNILRNSAGSRPISN